MLTINEIKSEARKDLAGNYRLGIRLAMFYFLINMTTTFIPTLFVGTGVVQTGLYLVACFVTFAISAYISIGLSACFLKIALCKPTGIGDFFEALRNKKSMGGLALWVASLEILPAMALTLSISFVPESYAKNKLVILLIYALYYLVILTIKMHVLPAFFLIHDIENDNPALVITMSTWLGRNASHDYLLKMWFSFIPLLIAGFLSFGIGLLYMYPYICSCNAIYYLELCKLAEETKKEE